MKNITILFISAILFISTSTIAGSGKAETKAKKNTATYVQVVKLNKGEEEKTYQIFLNKQIQFDAAKKAHKGDKKAFKSAKKRLNTAAEVELEMVIGSEKMKEMNKYFASNKKPKKNK